MKKDYNKVEAIQVFKDDYKGLYDDHYITLNCDMNPIHIHIGKTNHYYKYDNRGNPTFVKYGSGIIELRAFDKYNNMVHKISCVKTTPKYVHYTNTYDDYGRLIYHGSPTFEEWYEYNDNGDVIYYKSVMSGSVFERYMEYDYENDILTEYCYRGEYTGDNNLVEHSAKTKPYKYRLTKYQYGIYEYAN